MKKVLFLFLVSSFTFLSCDSSDSSIEEKAISNENEDSKLERRTLATMTAGELHNAYLDEMYAYLRGKENLNASNVHTYSREFFSTFEYPDLALKRYEYTINTPNVRYAFSRQLDLEIENFNRRLEISDFRNLNEFKIFVSSYRPLYIRERNDLIAWQNYTDVFSHSIIYWATNLERWGILINRNWIGLSERRCNEGGFWKRTWCKIKQYGKVDAGAFLDEKQKNPSASFEAAVLAGVAASGGEIIKDMRR
ncbi:hypothetical protein [Flavobacterium microcysteis]